MARKAPRSEVGGGPAEPAGSLCVAEDWDMAPTPVTPKRRLCRLQTVQTTQTVQTVHFFPLFFGEILTSRNTNIHKQDRRSPKT